jgi:hypothetical protein
MHALKKGRLKDARAKKRALLKTRIIKNARY